MSVTKDPSTNKWMSQIRVKDWTGKVIHKKKRGFTTREIAEKLKEYRVYIELSTLSKYMHEMSQETSQKSKASSTRRVKKPASQPASSATTHAPATPSETE